MPQPSNTRPQLAYHAVRISLALVYLFFGILKFFDGVSPAEFLAGETIHLLSFQLLPATVGLKILAVSETGLGIMLLFNWFPRTAFLLFLAHMAGTFTPFLVLPDLTFEGTTLAPTLIGQYILKNVVYVVAVSVVFLPVLFAGTEIPRFVRRLNNLFLKTSCEPATLDAGVTANAIPNQIGSEV